MKKIHYTKSDLFKESDVRVYERKTGDPKWPCVTHSHEYMQLHYIVNGECDHYVEDGVYHMTKGCILIIPPNVTHSVQNPSDDCILYGCEFPVEILFGVQNVNDDDIFRCAYVESLEVVIRQTRPCYVPSIPCQQSIIHSFEKMFTVSAKKLDYYELELKAETFILLVNIYRDYKNYQPEFVKDVYKEDIEKSVEYIKANYTKHLYIQDVASKATMCASYFSYFFRKIMGCTFIDYVNSLRIHKAKELLECTDYSVNEISDTVGFNNVTYFNRVFKASEGVSPGQFRDLHDKNKND